MNTVGIKEDIEKEAKSYYETLKKDCKTYGELQDRIRELHKDALWRPDTVKEMIAKYMQDKCKKEMRSIPIQENEPKTDQGMDEVIKSLKACVLRTTEGLNNAAAQEIAILPKLVEILERHYQGGKPTKTKKQLTNDRKWKIRVLAMETGYDYEFLLFIWTDMLMEDNTIHKTEEEKWNYFRDVSYEHDW